MAELYLHIFVLFLFFSLYWGNFLSTQAIFLQRLSFYLGGYPFKDRRRISGVPWEKIENSIKTCLLVNTIETFCVITGVDPGVFLGGQCQIQTLRWCVRGGGGGGVGRSANNFFRYKNKGGSGPRRWRGCTTREWREWGCALPAPPLHIRPWTIRSGTHDFFFLLNHPASMTDFGTICYNFRQVETAENA